MNFWFWLLPTLVEVDQDKLVASCHGCKQLFQHLELGILTYLTIEFVFEIHCLAQKTSVKSCFNLCSFKLAWWWSDGFSDVSLKIHPKTCQFFLVKASFFGCRFFWWKRFYQLDTFSFAGSFWFQIFVYHPFFGDFRFFKTSKLLRFSGKEISLAYQQKVCESITESYTILFWKRQDHNWWCFSIQLVSWCVLTVTFPYISGILFAARLEPWSWAIDHNR